jgi:hypothetical protein
MAKSHYVMYDYYSFRYALSDRDGFGHYGDLSEFVFLKDVVNHVLADTLQSLGGIGAVW